LSMMQVPDSTFTATHFENSKIMGVNWTVARWPTIRLIDPISFSKCTIKPTLQGQTSPTAFSLPRTSPKQT
jgi:hypothetical protein